MNEPNVFHDARLFWTLRAGKLHQELEEMVREAFREHFQPADDTSVGNVDDLSRGRTIALWMAAAVSDPEWAERMVAWTLTRDDPNVRAAIAEIRRVMTLAAGEELAPRSS